MTSINCAMPVGFQRRQVQRGTVENKCSQLGHYYNALARALMGEERWERPYVNTPFRSSEERKRVEVGQLFKKAASSYRCVGALQIGNLISGAGQNNFDIAVQQKTDGDRLVLQAKQALMQNFGVQSLAA